MKRYFSILIISLALFNYSVVNIANAATSASQTSTHAAETTKEANDSVTTKASDETSNANHAAEEDTGVVGMFGINWKLFLAQLVNFGIVVFVLWKFVFKPVTSGLTARTEKIENSLKEAEQIAKDRGDFDSWKKDEISKVRTEASAIITEAKQTAENLKADTLKATSEEQTRLVEQTKERLEQEKQAMIESAKGELADIVVTATAAILQNKIDPAKDKDIIADALKKAQDAKK